MKLKTYSILDLKSGAYERPICFKMKGEAVRWFQHVASNEKPDNMLYTNAEDFVMYEIGEFDTERGELIPYKEPVVIGKAIEFRRPNEIGNGAPVQ